MLQGRLAIWVGGLLRFLFPRRLYTAVHGYSSQRLCKTVLQLICEAAWPVSHRHVGGGPVSSGIPPRFTQRAGPGTVTSACAVRAWTRSLLRKRRRAGSVQGSAAWLSHSANPGAPGPRLPRGGAGRQDSESDGKPQPRARPVL